MAELDKQKLKAWLRASRIRIESTDPLACDYDPFALYQEGKISKGRLLEVIVDEVDEYIKDYH